MGASWLHSDEFVAHAPDAIGAQRAINHTDCPAGIDRKQRLYIKRTLNGVVAYCHHCGKKGAAFKHSGEAVWHALEHAPVSREAVREGIELLKYEDALRWVEYYEHDCRPAPTPSSMMVAWADRKGFQAGALFSEARAKYGAPDGEAPGLIFPIRASDGRVVGVQVRRDFGIRNRMKGPKYETKLLEKTAPYTYGNTVEQREVVLVEDYLSAQRLAPHIAAVPLYGSSMPDGFLAHLLNFYALVVWLDNDKPEVMEAATNIAVRAEPLFDQVTVIGDCKEPTKYTDAELRAILQDWELI